jgi:hypothetical protein
MIKFFRKIRKNMLTENKFSKYLLYAVGEIILVVIGILIALGINNWNIKSKTNSNNKLYLAKMLNDLEDTKYRLNKIVYDGVVKWPSSKDAVKSCDTLLKLSYQGFTSEHLEFFIKQNYDSGNSLLNVANNTYQEMLNTGKIYTLESQSLIKLITRYYRMCQIEAGYNRVNSDIVLNALEEIKDGFGKIKMDYEINSKNFDLSDYPFFTDKNSKEYKSFQVNLYSMREGQQRNMDKMLFVVRKTDSLQALIRNHLKH